MMDSDTDGTALWQRRLSDLRDWKHKHGHCTVPKAEGKLGRWVVRQRELFKKGKLHHRRRDDLDTLDFVWNTNNAAWQRRYNLLVEYAYEHGHCCVPIAHPKLGMWVAKMRANHRRGKLPQPRVAKLVRIGFVWNTAETDWMDKFDKLLQFRKRHGHSCVPFNEGDLGWWVNTQRQCKRKGKLVVEREALLNQAGFVWNPQQFLAARRRHGLVAAAATANLSDSHDHADVGKGHPTDAERSTEPQDTSLGAPLDARTTEDVHVRSPPHVSSFQVHGSDSAGTVTTALSRVSDDALDETRLSPNGRDAIASRETSVVLEHSSPRTQPSTNADSPPLRCDKLDVQSIASLLSPSPAPPRAEMADQVLPSFHYGGLLASLTWRPHFAAIHRDFVLPPISSLKAVRDASMCVVMR